MSKNRALISVTDKTGLVPLATGLAQLFELVSTGGTASAIDEAGIPVTLAKEVTGFPEMMDGRVKTMHPRLHGGILARRDEPKDLLEAAEHGIGLIDLVVCNLYQFELRPSIGEIDIGGPSMIRAAAKNYAWVGVVTDPADYGWVLEELNASDGTLSLQSRQHLAAKAFALTAKYDAAVADWFKKEMS